MVTPQDKRLFQRASVDSSTFQENVVENKKDEGNVFDTVDNGEDDLTTPVLPFNDHMNTLKNILDRDQIFVNEFNFGNCQGKSRFSKLQSTK
mmetsp:Transcript_24286/g.23896  ORF Transcript_24286/g.23896 Transcript_24286/m.23896 type:complete len:92 (-) Transcript_24286:458-733(-)